jgi:hypothetical protein
MPAAYCDLDLVRPGTPEIENVALDDASDLTQNHRLASIGRDLLLQ